MLIENLVKAENLKTGMTYWDGTTITVESSTACYVTVNFSDGKGLSVSRKIRKTSEIRVLEPECFDNVAENEASTGSVKVFVKSTGRGSDWYGNCECCGKHVSEVFHTTAEQEYIDPDTMAVGLTGYKMPHGKWGHLNCVNEFALQLIQSIGKGGEVIPC
jgi:hypothetical protein